jgi:hypothetical protein
MIRSAAAETHSLPSFQYDFNVAVTCMVGALEFQL